MTMISSAPKPKNLPNPMISATRVERPSFLMCPPFAHDVGVANNIWMTDYKEGERHLNRGRSYTQFLDLYNYLHPKALFICFPRRPTAACRTRFSLPIWPSSRNISKRGRQPLSHASPRHRGRVKKNTGVRSLR